ncbi:alpha/beta hydrolase [Calothrix sp. 336/3]|uniref:alpha/beta hydrolase n=1 Tax=Calothrix sp. 336/3 TaxID=1337936 RepID=UPI0004E43768|nr:alpha/beta hydrolase [Calothrix sp. 336/3]AKG20303.1 dienelactone hydrolase [Calothrix sp. 336/3]
MRIGGKHLKIFANGLGGIIFMYLWGLFASVQAAEKVVVRFGSFAESISVADLKQVAETGKFPAGYGIYTNRLSSAQRDLIIKALRTNLPISVVAMNRLLNTQVGTTILRDLAAVTQREDTAAVPALRAALVLGATDKQGLSILSFIANYPSQRLEIDLAQAFRVTSNLNLGFWRTQQFMVAIAPKLAHRSVSLSLPFDPSQAGKAQFQVLNLTLDDSKRGRKIPVDIYWSEAATPEKPVIVFTHGLGSVKTELKYLAEHLASHGYVVAALEHPGSNGNNTYRALAGKNRLMQPQEFRERPRDISFLLDELAKLNTRGDSPLQGKLATDNTLVLGYSFGGSTALSLGGAELQLEHLKQRCQSNLATLSLGEGIQCIAQELPENTYQFRDARVKSAIALNPTTSLMFGDSGLSKIQVPTLVLAASADKTTPALVEQVFPFEQIPSPKWLVAILGGTHLSVKDPSVTLDQPGRASTPYSGDEIVDEKAQDIRQFTKAVVLAMAAQLTPQAKEYAIFLTADYAQSASTEAFPFRIITEIPTDALTVVQEYVQKK